MKIAFTTLGCKLNYAETATYERGFMAAGWEVVPWTEQADVSLINTCAVTTHAEQKSRGFIRRAHKTAPQAKIIVTGCYAELKREELMAMDGVYAVYGAGEKSRIVPDLVAAASGLPAPEDSWEPILPAYSSGERTRSFLKVQDGCNNYCKYCTVPYARGESRNLPIAECVQHAEQIAAEGVKEIVLTGVNTGDFGRTTGESFLDLLQALNRVEGIERYRISSIEPNLLTDGIVDWIASGTKFQPHFHIPLQTGSDELLSRMGRHYDTAFFADRIGMIRRKMERPGAPKVFFGIDVMVGLPGETDVLFKDTFRFIDRVHPAFIHVFPYSRRPGTPAASMPGQVEESVKKHRVAVLEELCARLHAEFREANRDVAERVLFESTERGGMMEGYTGNYIRIARPYDPALVGKLVDIVID